MLKYIDHPSIKLAKLLVKEPSISPKDFRCQQILAEKLIQFGFEIDSWKINDTSNLLAIKDKGPPYFLFSAHTDVVPTGDIIQWKHPPFEPTIVEDKFYGRGIVDMKGALAAFITALEVFDHVNGSILVAITSDEQGAAINGTKSIVEKIIEKNISVDYCLIGSPSSNKSLADCIKIGRRGSLNGFITIKGALGHVAYPGFNVLHELDTLISLLKNIKIPNDQSNIDFNLTYLSAGDGTTNVIPAYVDMQFNFRYPHTIDYLDIISTVQELLEKLDLNYQINWNHGAMPYICKKDFFANKIKNVLHDKYGINSVINTTGGASDGRFLNALNCQIAELGLCTEKINEIDEYASVKDIIKLSEIYNQILKTFLK